MTLDLPPRLGECGKGGKPPGSRGTEPPREGYRDYSPERLTQFRQKKFGQALNRLSPPRSESSSASPVVRGRVVRTQESSSARHRRVAAEQEQQEEEEGVEGDEDEDGRRRLSRGRVPEAGGLPATPLAAARSLR